MRNLLALRIVATALGMAAMLASAQTHVDPSQIHTTPWVGSKGITESVAKIMARAGRQPPRGFLVKTEEKEGPDRSHLLDNPRSPQVSNWPPRPGGAQFFAPGFSTRVSGPIGFTLGTNFLASQLQNSSFTPPDSMGAVGPTQIFETVNGRFRVFSRTGVLGSLDTDSDSFFSSVRAGTFTSDPRVRFDRFTNRWFVVMINTTQSSNRVLLAVSSGPTISGTSSFTFYQFQHDLVTPAGDTGDFMDYPTLGIDANALYIGGNMFNPGFAGTSGFVVRKSSMLSGGPLVVTAFRGLSAGGSGAGIFTPQGVDNDNPAATTGFFIGVSNSTNGLLGLRQVFNPGGSPSISAETDINVPATASPTGVTVLGSTKQLDALDDRLYAAKLVTNVATGVQTLWTAHNLLMNASGNSNQAGDRVGSRWYQIGNIASPSPVVLQAGTVVDGSSSANSIWIPSTTMTGQGYAVLAASEAGPNLHAGDVFTYQVAGMPLGVMSAPIQIVAGAGAYNTSETTPIYRWGDFSHTLVDPNDDMTVWTVQMYCSVTRQWGIRIAQLLAPPPAIVTSVVPNTVLSNSTAILTVTGTSTSGQGFFDPGPSYPNHISAQFGGTGLTVNSVTFLSANQVQVSVTAAAGALSGSRSLTVFNPDGQSSTLANAISVQGSPSVSGKITLGDFVGIVSALPVTIELRNPGTTTALSSQTVLLDSSGNYAAASGVSPGTYDIAFRAGTFLRKVVRNVVLAANGASGVNVTLTNGDVNGDNKVDNADRRAILTAYGSRPGYGRWNPRADLNGDKVVGGIDYSIASKNLGLIGDQ